LPSVAATVFQRGRDWQFFSPGYRASIQAVAMAIPFGRERDGTMLSDHVGYGVTYRLTQAIAAHVRPRRVLICSAINLPAVIETAIAEKPRCEANWQPPLEVQSERHEEMEA
jgi:hypothetical protein